MELVSKAAQVLAYPVEDDDRIVNGVTDDGQDDCDEAGVDLQLEDRRYSQGDQHVVQDRQQRRGTEGPVFELDQNVDKNQCAAKQQGQDRVLHQFGTDRWTYKVLLTDNRVDFRSLCRVT